MWSPGTTEALEEHLSADMLRSDLETLLALTGEGPRRKRLADDAPNADAGLEPPPPRSFKPYPSSLSSIERRSNFFSARRLSLKCITVEETEKGLQKSFCLRRADPQKASRLGAFGASARSEAVCVRRFSRQAMGALCFWPPGIISNMQPDTHSMRKAPKRLR